MTSTSTTTSNSTAITKSKKMSTASTSNKSKTKSKINTKAMLSRTDTMSIIGTSYDSESTPNTNTDNEKEKQKENNEHELIGNDNYTNSDTDNTDTASNVSTNSMDIAGNNIDDDGDMHTNDNIHRLSEWSTTSSDGHGSEQADRQKTLGGAGLGLGFVEDSFRYSSSSGKNEIQQGLDEVSYIPQAEAQDEDTKQLQRSSSTSSSASRLSQASQTSSRSSTSSTSRLSQTSQENSLGLASTNSHSDIESDSDPEANAITDAKSDDSINETDYTAPGAAGAATYGTTGVGADHHTRKKNTKKEKHQKKFAGFTWVAIIVSIVVVLAAAVIFGLGCCCSIGGRGGSDAVQKEQQQAQDIEQLKKKQQQTAGLDAPGKARSNEDLDNGNGDSSQQTADLKDVQKKSAKKTKNKNGNPVKDQLDEVENERQEKEQAQKQDCDEPTTGPRNSSSKGKKTKNRNPKPRKAVADNFKKKGNTIQSKQGTKFQQSQEHEKQTQSKSSKTTLNQKQSISRNQPSYQAQIPSPPVTSKFQNQIGQPSLEDQVDANPNQSSDLTGEGGDGDSDDIDNEQEQGPQSNSETDSETDKRSGDKEQSQLPQPQEEDSRTGRGKEKDMAHVQEKNKDQFKKNNRIDTVVEGQKPKNINVVQGQPKTPNRKEYKQDTAVVQKGNSKSNMHKPSQKKPQSKQSKNQVSEKPYISQQANHRRNANKISQQSKQSKTNFNQIAEKTKSIKYNFDKVQFGLMKTGKNQMEILKRVNEALTLSQERITKILTSKNNSQEQIIYIGDLYKCQLSNSKKQRYKQIQKYLSGGGASDKGLRTIVVTTLGVYNFDFGKIRFGLFNLRWFIPLDRFEFNYTFPNDSLSNMTVVKLAKKGKGNYNLPKKCSSYTKAEGVRYVFEAKSYQGNSFQALQNFVKAIKDGQRYNDPQGKAILTSRKLQIQKSSGTGVKGGGLSFQTISETVGMSSMIINL